MFYLLVLVGAILSCIYCVLQRYSRNWKLLSEYPGDYPLPIVGNGLQLGFDIEKSPGKILNLWKKHGMQNFRLTVGSEEWLLVTNPDDVATILNHPTELSKQVERNTGMKSLFGNSLSTADGERWIMLRKLIGPSFHFNTLERRIDTINTQCDLLFQLLDDQSTIDVYKYLKPYMFNIVCSSLMGVDMNLLDLIDHPYFEASSTVIKIITENYYSYWRQIPFLATHFTKLNKETMRVADILEKMSNYIIAQRKEKIQTAIQFAENNNHHTLSEKLLENEGFESSCLLDRLIFSKLYSGVALPQDYILEEVQLLCWTGHHSTSLALCHALYCIAKYPEVQKRILDEQNLIFKGDQLKKPNNKELNEMKYMEAVIKEAIRIIPTINKISRKLKNDLQLRDGRLVPANTTLVIFYKAIYKDPKLFTEPDKFNPERFFMPMHNYAFVPFSSGPRNCIAFRFGWASMKATISNLIRRYELSLAGPGTEPQFVYRLMTQSNNGIQIRIKRRVY